MLLHISKVIAHARTGSRDGPSPSAPGARFESRKGQMLGKTQSTIPAGSGILACRAPAAGTHLCGASPFRTGFHPCWPPAGAGSWWPWVMPRPRRVRSLRWVPLGSPWAAAGFRSWLKAVLGACWGGEPRTAPAFGPLPGAAPVGAGSQEHGIWAGGCGAPAGAEGIVGRLRAAVLVLES